MTADLTFLTKFFGDKKNNSQTVLATLGSTGAFEVPLSFLAISR